LFKKKKKILFKEKKTYPVEFVLFEFEIAVYVEI